mgnify:CR=1 FL=1
MIQVAHDLETIKKSIDSQNARNMFLKYYW